MIKRIWQTLFTLVLLLSTLTAVAADVFKVAQIQVEGLQRINKQTVLDAVPVKTGQFYHQDNAADIIQALYQTGFFEKISVLRRQKILVIRVKERPTIERVKIAGNKIATEEDLKKSLKAIGLAEGEFYDPAIVDGVVRSLKRQYIARGNQQVTIDPTIKEISRNRVQVTLHITEGRLARIDDINFFGNQHFDRETLLKNMPIATSGIMTVFNRKDIYSEESLAMALEALKNFYQNQGYVQFKVLNQEVIHSTDNKYVRLNITIEEGERYHLADWTLAGNVDEHQAELTSLVTLQAGAWFSRKDVMDNAARINHYFGQRGFAMVKVEPVPQFDHANRTVFMRYFIETGAEMYVRRINFSGNFKTQANVLRREQRQLEGALFNSDLVQASVRKIRLLGYIKNVDLNMNPVVGRPDQIDLDYKINEAIRTGSLSAGLGIGSDNGLFGQAGFQQPNFLGSGKTFGLNFSINKAKTSLSFNYDNPYFTDDGISSGISAYAQHIDAEKVNITDYSISLYGASYTLGIPMSEDDKLRLMLGYEHVDLSVGNHPSPHIQYFKDMHGSHFNELILQMSWIHNGYDRGLFPTKGYYHNASVMVSLPKSTDELTYYKTHYYGHYYQPLWRNFILSLRSELGFGDGYDDFDQMPFFKNFYAGGSQSIRGYRFNTLGPRAISPYTGREDDTKTIGGNLLLMGSVALVIPPLHHDLRTSLFFDFGNVFNTNAHKYDHCKHPSGLPALRTLCQGAECAAFADCRDLDGTVRMSDIRSSMGVSFEWISPMGPILISFATPVKKLDGDRPKVFQFSVGTIL